jgi:uncharacterized protein with NAD-binding domain and iron-sulfur cluster
MKKTVSIFGGGIAGMTVAHELVEKGFDVIVYEKDDSLGGMAKSKRNNTIPSEHSWRGYAKFYYNALEILKRIPIKNSCKKESYQSQSISLEEVKKHTTKDNLWTYYKGNVYDITAFVLPHPGGNIILNAGGKNLEEVWNKFNVKWHNNHSRVLKILEQYKIGVLATEEYEPQTTVFDNLSDKDLNFSYLENDKPYNRKLGISIYDYPYLFYIFSKCLLSNKRREYWFDQYFIEYIKDKVSNETYNYLMYGISGPGFGFDFNTISLEHFVYFIEQDYQTDSIWKVMMKPTSEAWIDPWKEYLESKGVKFMMGKELSKINYEGKNITSCVLSDGTIIKSDEYCLCINPYPAIEIFKNSGMNKLHEQHLSIKTINNQIGFYIAFDKKINFPKDKNAFVIIDSPYNITFYSQDEHWCKNINLGENVKSLWSGTCIIPQEGIQLTREKFMEEVVKQIFDSKSLLEMLKNEGSIKESIVSSEIYDEWIYQDGQLESINRKWNNNVSNEKHRPEQKTDFENFYIGGAHTKTSINIWTMESAVESGKIVSNLILRKNDLKETTLVIHESIWVVKIVQNIDDILYTYNLPNIIDVIVIILTVILVLMVYQKMRK